MQLRWSSLDDQQELLHGCLRRFTIFFTISVGLKPIFAYGPRAVGCPSDSVWSSHACRCAVRAMSEAQQLPSSTDKLVASVMKHASRSQLKTAMWTITRATVAQDLIPHALAGCSGSSSAEGDLEPADLASQIADRLISSVPDMSRLLCDDASTARARRNVAMHSKSEAPISSLSGSEVKRLQRGRRKTAESGDLVMQQHQKQTQVFSIDSDPDTSAPADDAITVLAERVAEVEGSTHKHEQRFLLLEERVSLLKGAFFSEVAHVPKITLLADDVRQDAEQIVDVSVPLMPGEIIQDVAPYFMSTDKE